jgi:HlyD family secretion protein
LAADQASADAAAAQVTVAQANLADASVVSPIDGTVVTVSVSPGGSAGAGSTAFVIAGLDSYQVVTTVAVADLPDLKVGQRASVQPDGTSTPPIGIGSAAVSASSALSARRCAGPYGCASRIRLTSVGVRSCQTPQANPRGSLLSSSAGSARALRR